MALMRRRGIRHAALAHQISLLGHTDRIVVGDMGLPLPRHIPVIDLALVPGHMAFTTVLDALLDDVVVQAHIAASESFDIGRTAGSWLDARADLLGQRTLLTHQEFKDLLPHVTFAIRTGEATPYANIILESGVPF